MFKKERICFELMDSNTAHRKCYFSSNELNEYPIFLSFSFTVSVEENKTIKQRPHDLINFIRKSIKIKYRHKKFGESVLTNKLFDHFHILKLQQLFKHVISVEHLVVFWVTQ